MREDEIYIQITASGNSRPTTSVNCKSVNSTNSFRRQWRNGTCAVTIHIFEKITEALRNEFLSRI